MKLMKQPLNTVPMQGFNLNQTEQEWVFDVRDTNTVTVQAALTGTGTWGTAVLTIGRSNNGKQYQPLVVPQQIGPGGGMTEAIDCASFAFLHVKLTTEEGSAAFADLTVMGSASIQNPIHPVSVAISGGALTWQKFTKTYADFSAAATTNDIEITELPEGTFVHATRVMNTVQFAGGSLSSYTLQFGYSGQEAVYSDGTLELFGADQDYCNDTSNLTQSQKFVSGGSRSVRAYVESAGDDLDAATAGSVDFWLLTSQLP